MTLRAGERRPPADARRPLLPIGSEDVFVLVTDVLPEVSVRGSSPPTHGSWTPPGPTRSSDASGPRSSASPSPTPHSTRPDQPPTARSPPGVTGFAPTGHAPQPRTILGVRPPIVERVLARHGACGQPGSYTATNSTGSDGPHLAGPGQARHTPDNLARTMLPFGYPWCVLPQHQNNVLFRECKRCVRFEGAALLQ